jgi:hypothetical protein
MSIFDAFTNTTKKIYRADFEKALRQIPELSDKERAYVEGVFQSALRDGLSKYELKQEISSLRHNSNDPLDAFEVEKIKKKLMSYF